MVITAAHVSPMNITAEGLSNRCRARSFIYSFYSFEYVWSMQSVDFVSRIQRIEANW